MMKWFAFFLFYVSVSQAQKPFVHYKNALKSNATVLATGLGSLQYERMLNQNWSISATVFGRQKSNIPLGTTFDKLANRYGESIIGVNFDYIQVDKAQLGLAGISPEIRRYFGRKPTRFFLSAFYQFEKMDLMVPAELVIQLNDQFYNSLIPVSFDVRASSIGFMPGIQFRKGRWGVDWTILGPRFGAASYLRAEAQQSFLNRLSDEEKDFLIQGVKERFQLSDEFFDVSIQDSQAQIQASRRVPYWLVRGFGLNVFYYF